MRQGGEGRRWLAAGLLTASAYLSGTGFSASLCYWQGRLQARAWPLTLAVEAPADASVVLAVSLGALMWGLLWLLFARAQRWKRFGGLLGGAPLAMFCWAAWRAAAASCSAF